METMWLYLASHISPTVFLWNWYSKHWLWTIVDWEWMKYVWPTMVFLNKVWEGHSKTSYCCPHIAIRLWTTITGNPVASKNDKLSAICQNARTDASNLLRISCLCVAVGNGYGWLLLAIYCTSSMHHLRNFQSILHPTHFSQDENLTNEGTHKNRKTTYLLELKLHFVLIAGSTTFEPCLGAG